MTSTTRRGIVALIAVLLGGFVVAVPPAAAAVRTQGFQVLNLTSRTLKLVKYGEKVGDNPELPRIAPNGNLYLPGIEPDFQVDRTNRVNSVVLYFQLDDGTNRQTAVFDMLFHVSDLGIPQTVSTVRAYQPGKGVRIDVDGGKYIRIYDADATTVDASSWTPREQASLVGRLCRHNGDSDRGPVRCGGSITSEGPPDPTFAAWEVVDGPYGNNNCSASESTFTEGRTKTLTHAWEIETSASYGLKDVWQTALKLKYTGSIVTSERYDHTEKHMIQPGTRVAMVSAVPVLRFIGEYSIRAGNTEWFMRDVPVDILDTDRPASRDFVASPINPNDAIAKKPSFCP